jgi:hypothetical protein
MKSETRPQGDPDATLTAVVGVVGAVLIFVVVVGLVALYQRAENAELTRKQIAPAPAELESVRAEQLGQLHGYRWVDAKKGIAAIPIERAMDLVVRESAAGRR